MSDAAPLPSLHTARSSQLAAALSRGEQKVAPFPCHSRIGAIWEVSGPSGSEYRSDSEAGLTVWKPSDPHLATSRASPCPADCSLIVSQLRRARGWARRPKRAVENVRCSMGICDGDSAIRVGGLCPRRRATKVGTPGTTQSGQQGKPAPVDRERQRALSVRELGSVARGDPCRDAWHAATSIYGGQTARK